MINTARSTSFCLSIQTNCPCAQSVIHKMLGHLDGCHCRVAEQDRTIWPKDRSVSVPVEMVPLGSRRRWWPCADDWCTPAGSTWGTSVKGGWRSTSSLTGSVHVVGANILYTHTRKKENDAKWRWKKDRCKKNTYWNSVCKYHNDSHFQKDFRWRTFYQFKTVFLKLYSIQKQNSLNQVCMLRHSS